MNVQLFCKRATAALLLVVSICTLKAAAPALAESPIPSTKTTTAITTIRDLSWLAGKWKSKNENPGFEEHWMTPHDGCMVGMGREVNGEKMEFFEYLRIEQRQDGFFYVAQPRGKSQTDFKLTSVAKSKNLDKIKFENPEHDFPKAIEYEKRPDGSLTVRVSGDDKKEKSFQHVLYKFY